MKKISGHLILKKSINEVFIVLTGNAQLIFLNN